MNTLHNMNTLQNINVMIISEKVRATKRERMYFYRKRNDEYYNCLY